MGKRSRSSAITRYPANSSNAVTAADNVVDGPPRKKHAVGNSNDTETIDARSAGREVRTSSVIPSVSPSSSSSPSPPADLPANQRQHHRHHEEREWQSNQLQRAGSKRSRDDAFGQPKPHSSAGHRSGVRRREDDKTDGTVSSAAPATNRTLVYETATASPGRSGQRHSGESSATTASAASSPPPPQRRGVVLLTSTPAFLRQRRNEANAFDDKDDDKDDARRAPGNVSAVSSPLRLFRAAQGFFSPARSTLMRGFSHLQQSVTGTTPRPDADASVSPVSPLGRWSSIHRTQEHLPSLPADRAGQSRHRGDRARRGEPAATASTLLSLGVSSIPGSRRSSVSSSSASDVWGGRGQRDGAPRLTIHRDSAEDVRSSASVHTASLSSSRMSSPPAQEQYDSRSDARSSRHLQRQRRHRGSHSSAEGNNRYGEAAGRAAAAAAAALAGPTDARYATVSTLSESLANVVSSSRSTAQSSLTSAGAPAAAAAASVSAGGRGTSAASRDTSAGATAVPRQSATLAEPEWSSILPDEEERGVRQRMQRHGQADSKEGGQRAGHSSQQSRKPLSNVLELPYVRPRPQPPPLPPSRAAEFSRDHPVDGDAARRTEGGLATTADAPQRRRAPRAFRSATATTPTWHLLATLSRLSLGMCATLLCLWCVAATAWPLLSLHAPHDITAATPYAAAVAAFLDLHVNPVADLQALYQIAPASLTADEVARLHRRTLSEGVERLERATQHLLPRDDNVAPPRRLLYYRAMIHAYLAVQRSSELYARSRDSSLVRRLVTYPLTDALTYGVYRFDSVVQPPDSSLHVSAKADWWDRLRTSVACSAQSEMLSCPSVLYVETAMARAAAPFVYTDANEQHESPQRRRRLRDWRTQLRRDWTSEVYLETLLSYMRSSVQELTRDYNR